MNHVEVWGAVVGFLLSIAALVKVVIPAWRATRRFAARVSGSLDNLGGRDSFVDHATGKTVPAIPPIGERFASIEHKLDGLRDTSSRLDALDLRVTSAEGRVSELETAVGLLAGSQFERGATAALSAVEKLQEGQP